MNLPFWMELLAELPGSFILGAACFNLTAVRDFMLMKDIWCIYELFTFIEFSHL